MEVTKIVVVGRGASDAGARRSGVWPHATVVHLRNHRPGTIHDHPKKPPGLLLALAASCTAASAATIVCTPGPAAGNAPFNAVRRIAIDEFSRTVNLDVVRSKTRETETLGKMRADLVGMDESSGDPVYVFNSIPTSEVETTTFGGGRIG